jgi:3-hydroxybutyrate dehydrogenase
VLVHGQRPKARAIAEEFGGVFLQADLSDPAAVRRLAEQALATTGRVDILVNNAGFQTVAAVEGFPEATWDKMIQVLLTAPFQLTKYLLPGMKQRRWGRIINVASIHGLVASPFKAAYVSAKHGLLGLTKTVALEAGVAGLQ